MTRRGFLGSILALAAAPAIVRADSLMRIVPRSTALLPAFYEDTIYIDQMRNIRGPLTGLNDPDAVKRWAAMLAVEYSKGGHYFEKFAGPGQPILLDAGSTVHGVRVVEERASQPVTNLLATMYADG